MYAETLAAALKAKGWSLAEFARRVGVTRQAVSLWLSSPRAAVTGAHLLKAAEVLGLPAESLDRPLPGLGPERDVLSAAYLWDHLYPALDDFAIAVNRWDLRAVGRLVEVGGLYAAERAVGRSVWKRFGDYARYIHPARRRQLERLVEWQRTRIIPTPN
jgi:transcriptional regulator with XRE-family HTH domain